MTGKNPPYRTDAEVVWCPGCGDYGIMRALSDTLAAMEIPEENIVLISGIGCSSRMPGYFNVYGFNTVHGRALPIAQGAKIARPELTVLVASGDGDALAIGAGHFVHAGRRNADITMILFDNEVYGLTKGQGSPTTPTGDKMKLASYGVAERPLRPVPLAISFGATFVARSFAGDIKHQKEMFTRAIQHRGFSVVQVLTPCVTFRGRWNPNKTIRERKAYLPTDHDATSQAAALAMSPVDEEIRLGVFYQVTDQPTFGDRMQEIENEATVGDVPPVDAVLQDFVK